METDGPDRLFATPAIAADVSLHLAATLFTFSAQVAFASMLSPSSVTVFFIRIIVTFRKNTASSDFSFFLERHMAADFDLTTSSKYG